ncbi:helix-turn-helix domain-containing protein [Mycobacterium sp.]
MTGLSHTTVRKRIRQKRIRAVRIAGNWRIVRADLAGLQ